MNLTDHLHHVAVEVADLDAAVKWYEEHLDFVFERRFRLEESTIEIAYLTTPTFRIELLRRGDGDRARRSPDSPPPVERRQPMHICFQVDDIEAAAEELRRRGIEFAQEPRLIEPARLKNCWIKDPEGNLIEFVEPI
jgi:catechol 2,3-dioxygenase-like lactoylglutathione lyase family enzyme